MTQFAKKIKLTNGLSVIFEKNDNANVVSLNIGVKVGSVDETNDESGICHVIEHMVFKGTKSYGAGEIATLVEANGGELNAYTSLDQTAYYINLPSKHFSLGLNILKEMIFDAIFDKVELEREKEVIVEEIRRGQDSPHRILGEALFQTAFKQHPYRRPVIGTEKLVRGFSREKIYEFYKKYYTPKNMILGICGNIEEAELSQKVEDLFRFEVSKPITSKRIIADSIPKKPKVVTKSMDIQATYFDLAFPVPHLTHEDVPALDVLSHLLGESDTSLLEQNTKSDEGLVHHIYSSCYTPKHPGLFMIGGMIKPENINKALASIKKQIEHVQKHLFEVEKIERSKILARAQVIFSKQTCEGTARKWITYETSGTDFKHDEKYIESINTITAQDIQKVAIKYLKLSASTFVVLHPKKVKPKIDKNILKTATPKRGARFKTKSHYKQSSIFTLDNGIRVAIRENHRLPIIAMKTASLGGLRYETANNNGINNLLSNTLNRGTTSLSSVALSEKLEWLVANLGCYTGRNSFGLSYNFLSEKLSQAIPLLSDVVLNPAFDKTEVTKERNLQLEAIKNSGDNASHLVFYHTLKELFKGHPYQRNLLGTAKSVKTLKQTQLSNYYNSFMVPKNLVISCVGDFNTEDMLMILNDELGGLKNKKFAAKKFKKPSMPKKTKSFLISKNKKQAHVAIGFLGTSFYGEDKYILEIINNILSGQGGRLFLELRDKMSLAYTVSSTMMEGLETGFFGTYIGTEPSKVETAIHAMKEELTKLLETLISKEELDRAKNYIIGNHEIDHQKNSSIAMQFALNELYGKNLSEFYDFHKHINRITRKDVQRVARKFITLDRCIIGVVGPKDCYSI
jgi:zinc protease